VGDDDFGGFAPAVELDGVRVFHGDCVEVLRSLPDNSVDSIVTDPPYGLEFMGKDWDAPWKKSGDVLDDPASVGGFQDGAGGNPFSRSRIRYGRDNGAMIGFQRWATEWSVECLRVLKPGGHMLAFGGTRTWHRLAVAVEDAGFEIRDNIAWMYGSGFPKSLDVSKAIDKSNGENRARQLRFVEWMRSTGLKASEINEAIGKSDVGSHYLRHDQPAIATADLFDKLRPHLPPVPEEIERLVAERTGIEWTDYVKREVVAKGYRVDKKTSAVPISGATPDGHYDITKSHSPEAEKWQGWGTALKPAFEPIVVARKPLIGTVASNVLEWGTGGLNIDGSRIGTEEMLRKAGPAGIPSGVGNYVGNEKPRPFLTEQSIQGRWPANVILDEHTAGLLDEQSGVSKSRVGGKSGTSFSAGTDGSLRTDERKGHNDSGGASRFFYVAKASKRDRSEGLEDGNSHPTVKPTALMRYLVKLVTPPGGTVLDPFTGSGSTGKAAILEGFEFVGVELTEDYLPIIEGRLKWALENREEGTLF